MSVTKLSAAVVTTLAICLASARAGPQSGSARIAFTRDRPSLYSEIWTADRNGNHARVLIKLRHAAADEPAWSRSAGRVAFTVDHDPPSASQVDIYVARAYGKGVRRLTRGRTVNTAPAWSPDGRKIAFAKATHGGFRRLGLFVMRADGSRQHRLTPNACDDAPSWSPNGRKLVVARCGSLYVVNANGSGARRLTTPPPPDPSGSVFVDDQPDWSRDGGWIAFVRDEQLERGGDIANLYLIRPDGSGERQVTTGGDDWSPSWSPDGRLLTYASYARIDAVAINTGQTRTLVAIRSADLSSPAWRH